MYCEALPGGGLRPPEVGCGVDGTHPRHVQRCSDLAWLPGGPGRALDLSQPQPASRLGASGMLTAPTPEVAGAEERVWTMLRRGQGRGSAPTRRWRWGLPTIFGYLQPTLLHIFPNETRTVHAGGLPQSPDLHGNADGAECQASTAAGRPAGSKGSPSAESLFVCSQVSQPVK